MFTIYDILEFFYVKKKKNHPNVKYREVVGWLKEYIIADSELNLECY